MCLNHTELGEAVKISLTTSPILIKIIGQLYVKKKSLHWFDRCGSVGEPYKKWRECPHAPGTGSVVEITPWQILQIQGPRG